MKNLTIKFSLLCAMMAIFFVACEKDTLVSNSIDQLQTAPSKGAVAKMVESQRAGNAVPIQLFQNSRTANDVAIQQAVSEATLANLQLTAIENIRTEAPSVIQLQIPTIKSKDFELELVKVDIFADGFEVTNQLGHLVNGDLGIHYQGIIKGDNSSLAAISIYEDQVMGFFSNREGNYVIGKLETEQTNAPHIIYLDSDLKQTSAFSCDMSELSELTYNPIPQDQIEGNNRAVGTVEVYLEVDDDIYFNKGTGTTAYVTGLFNQSAVIYANEDINIIISDMLIWTSTSPYNSTNSFTQLETFKSQYSNSNPFDGDIGHLVSLGSSGIAAGFDGLCNAEIDNRMCYSAMFAFYNTVPVYSWSINVFTHEMGHLFGSRHTHACVWNGNNTAIDGCSSCQENPIPFGGGCNNCPQPLQPAIGGTIMSYCHNTSVGMNFNLGFGPQPGDLIRANVAACDNDNGCVGGGGGNATITDCGITVNISGLDVTLGAKILMGETIIKVRRSNWSGPVQILCNDWTGPNCVTGSTLTILDFDPNATYVVDVQNNGQCDFVIPVDINTGGTDNDNDGICSDVDCDDNDPNVGAQQTPGTACDDGIPSTGPDVILADGCTCQGPPISIDNDNDGIPSNLDCDDNDPNIGAQQTPGTACDDGNPSTGPDVILADGCTCQGQPINGCADSFIISEACSGVNVEVCNSNNEITITITDSSIRHITVNDVDAGWTVLELVCAEWTSVCNPGTYTYTVPASGNYSVQFNYDTLSPCSTGSFYIQ